MNHQNSNTLGQATKMDLRDKHSSDTCTKSPVSVNGLTKNISSENQSFTSFTSQQPQQKWEDESMLDYGITIEPSFQEFNMSSQNRSLLPHTNPVNRIKLADQEDSRINEMLPGNKIQNWDPRVMLNNLSFLEQKIHQLEDLVQQIFGLKDELLGRPKELVVHQQQLITADLTSIIAQLISTASTLLPSVKQTLGGLPFSSGTASNANVQLQACSGSQVPDREVAGNCGTEQNHLIEEHEVKDEEDVDDGENLPPGSYEILQLEKEEILAPHTHFCTICGKGFKRDANLRMHMRGHGDEYKSPAALTKPHKEVSSEPMLTKRYSCPFAGCRRNKDHKKFQPLKSILCVKNHYKRTHCDKNYTCSRCNTKKFSVAADLKTHEKHCGKDKWLCSCGTTFSRKDKLFGHITLFQGHTPAIPPDEPKVSSNEVASKVGNVNDSFGSITTTGRGPQSMMDMNGVGADNSPGCFSPLSFDTCNLGGFDEFRRPLFDDSESSFSFPVSGSCNYGQKSDGSL